MQNRSESLQYSPKLRGNNLTHSILVGEHMKSLGNKGNNQVFKAWNNKYTPFSPHSPFGDFPKEFLKNVEQTRVSPLVKNTKKTLQKLTEGTSCVNSRMSPYKKNQKSPPRAGAANRRLIPLTEFRRYYDRGDLPIRVDHSRAGSYIQWKTDPSQLDYHHFLPVFIDGLREKVDPYRFLSILGTFDLIDNGGEKILPVVPQLVIPIKTNLNTRDTEIIIITLRALQKLVLSGNYVGEAFVKQVLSDRL